MLRKCISFLPRLPHSLVPAPSRLHSPLAHFSFGTSNRPAPKKPTPDTQNPDLNARECQQQGAPGTNQLYDKLVQVEGFELDRFQEMDDSSKMYFLKVTALLFLLNVMARLMMKREKHFKSYERHH